MHRLRNDQTVSRFRLSAMLVLAQFVLIPGAVVFLIYALAQHSEHGSLVPEGLIVLAAALLVSLIQWIIGSRCRCPLCLGLPLVRSAAAKHRQALTLLGSYRLRVALSIVLRGQFRCPYCGEPTQVAVRAHSRSREPVR